jgi:hypothetical protein
MQPSNAKPVMTLHRETLAALDAHRLAAVAGGSVSNLTVACSNKPPTLNVTGPILGTIPAGCH